MGPRHNHTRDHGAKGGHSHAPADFGSAFAIGVVLNTAFVLVELTYGILAGSMALIADAGHNMSDVLALLLAWGASIAARRPPSSGFTYGYKSSTILAALANAGLLAVAIGAILFETLRRIFDPVQPDGTTMIIVAAIGILVNTATALMFMRGRKHDLNIRGAFLHMTADALVSLGVVIAGLGIIHTGAIWIDPLASLVIVAVIAWGTWGLARDSIKLALNAVPGSIDADAVRSYLAGLEGVEKVHDLHIWPMSTTETALTAHLIMPAGHPGDQFLREVAEELEHAHLIGHVTLQIESDWCCLGSC